MGEVRYDVFLSHAVEDKLSIANDLNVALKKSGLNVWYSGDELVMGDSILNSVNKAIANSMFGIVIISPQYLRKRWTMVEMQALFARENNSIKCILPVWHGVGYADIIEQLPILADRFAISSQKGINVIASHVTRAVRKCRGIEVIYKRKTEIPSQSKTSQPGSKVISLRPGFYQGDSLYGGFA